MKIELKKIATALGEVTTALTAGDKEVALAKLAEVATDLEAAQTEEATTDTPTAEEAAKTEEQIQNAVTAAVEVQLKKWADMYVSAEDFKALVASIKEVTDKLGTVESLAKTTEESLAKIGAEPGKTRQNEEDIKNTGKSPLDGLASRL